MTNFSLSNHKLTGAGGFIIVLLVLVLIGLGERVLYDLSRWLAGPDFNYFTDLATLLVHTIFVSILIAIAAIVNVGVAEKREKYAIVIIPYFIMAVGLAIQVAFEAMIYFYGHHTPLQFYLVMSTLVIVTTLLIYFIQKRYVPVQEISRVGSALWSVGRVLFIVFLVGISMVLLFVMVFFSAFR